MADSQMESAADPTGALKHQHQEGNEKGLKGFAAHHPKPFNQGHGPC
jgi:hypothetical protein